MIRAICLLLFGLWTGLAAAQDSLVAQTLEDQLSAPGRRVTITGLSGALSARATLQTLSVADEAGEWLRLENAVLDWNRAALLGGRLEINALTADRLEIQRAPQAPAGTRRAATGLVLPDLPISIEIAEMGIARIALGAALLGEPAILKLTGRASLVAGAADVAVDAQRLDGTLGRAIIALGFEPATEILSIDARLSEPPAGLGARALGLPGLPSVDLTIAGSGPLDRFDARIRLATDAIERLRGTVGLRATDKEARAFDLELAGDLRPLLEPQAAQFFGGDTDLRAQALAFADGRLQLNRLSFRSGNLRLQGAAELTAKRQPSKLALSGTIAGPAPLPGSDLQIDGAALDLRLDVSQSPDWDLSLVARGLQGGAFDADRLDLVGKGRVAFGAQVPFDGQIVAGVSGAKFADPGLDAAVGATPGLTTALSLDSAGQARLSDLVLRLAAGQAKGSAQVRPEQGTLAYSADIALDLPDLTQVAALAKLPLSGRAGANLQVAGAAPSGSIALRATAQTQDLRIGNAQLDPILSETTDLSLRAKRDRSGSVLETVSLTNSLLQVQASGPLDALVLNARLAQLSRLAPGLPGPARVSASLNKLRTLTARLETEIGLGLRLSGEIGLPNSAVDLRATGQIPLAFGAGSFGAGMLGNRALSGRADLDLRLRGAPRLGNLSGDISVDTGRISDPELGLALDPLAIRLTLNGGRADVVARAGVADGEIALGGQIALAVPFATRLDARLTRVPYRLADLATTRIDGQLALSGPGMNALAIAGTIGLSDTEIRVPDSGFGGRTAIPPLRQINAPRAVRQTLQRANLSPEAPGAKRPPIALALQIETRTPLFIRGRGLDAEFGGAIKLGGSLRAPRPVGRFDLSRGRLLLLGQRLDLSEGRVTLSGGLVPDLRVVAQTSSADMTAEIVLEGPATAPALTLSAVPDLPEDEILARLLYGRSAAALSPLQIVTLANGIATLAGRGGIGFGETIRDKLGVDDLDFRTGADGQTALALGRYLSEDIYTEVEIGGQGAGVSLNLDLTDDTRLKGSLGADGETGLGIFWQRDY